MNGDVGMALDENEGRDYIGGSSANPRRTAHAGTVAENLNMQGSYTSRQWWIQGGSLGSAEPPFLSFCAHASSLSFCAYASPASCARTSAVESVLDSGTYDAFLGPQIPS